MPSRKSSPSRERAVTIAVRLAIDPPEKRMPAEPSPNPKSEHSQRTTLCSIATDPGLAWFPPVYRLVAAPRKLPSAAVYSDPLGM